MSVPNSNDDQAGDKHRERVLENRSTVLETPATDSDEESSQEVIDEPAEHINEAGRKAVEGYNRVLQSPLVPGPTTFSGIVPYEAVNLQSLPPTEPDIQYNFIAGNYLVAPHILETHPGVVYYTHPESVIYYIAYRLAAERAEWIIGPDSIDEFVAHTDTFEWLALLLEYAKTTNNQALLEQLTKAHKVTEEAKSLVDGLVELYQARKGRKPTPGGSAVSLLIDVVLTGAGIGLAIKGSRERKRQERALVKLIEGSKNLGIEPFFEAWEQLDYDTAPGGGGREYHRTKYRLIFIDAENTEARITAREKVIEYCERQLEKLADIRRNRDVRERFKWIRETLQGEINALNEHGHNAVRPGGNVNIYGILNIHSTAREVINERQE